LNLSTLLQIIAQEYNFHVYHATPLENGYRLETNVGSKMAFLYKEDQHLQYSFQWRENLVKKGFRHFDRFIRTRDGAPFVLRDGEYVILQDAFHGRPLSLESLPTWEALGTLYGQIYDACSDLSIQNAEGAKQLQNQSLEPLFLTQEEMKSIKKKVFAEENMFSHLVRIHWSEVEKRWKQAQAIKRASSTQTFNYNLFPILYLEQWLILENGGLALQTKNASLASGFQSLSYLLERIYCMQDGEKKMEHFWNAFCSRMKLTLEDHYSVLSHLIYPETFISILHSYVDQRDSSDTFVERWMKECEQQEKLDQFYLWFAERIDRLREESISI